MPKSIFTLLSISDTVDHSVVRMVVSDPTRALMLLGESGVLAIENDVLMIESDNEPGTLARIAEELGKIQVNIEYAYLATSPKSNKGLMILRPNDVQKAPAALTGWSEGGRPRDLSYIVVDHANMARV